MKNFKIVIETLTAIAIIFGIFSYFNDRGNDRKLERNKMSLRYVERYQSGEVLAHKERLNQIWSQEHFGMFRASSKKIRDRYVQQVLAKNEGMKSDVYFLIFFYQEVISCASADLCSTKLLCPVIGRELSYFSNLYEGILVADSEIRGFDLSSFSKSVEDFSENCIEKSKS